MTVQDSRTLALDAIETASRDELSALQTERLAWSLRHAYDNVEHYRKKFDGHGVHPDDFREPADIAKFPFTTKEDLRECYPFGMFAVPMRDVVRVHASSGTTGKPTVVGYTAADIDNWAALMARSIRASGGTADDLVHISYGYGLFTGGLGAHYGVEKLGATAIPMSGGQTERQVQLIRDFRPDIIMVTPSYMLALADEMDAQGLSAEECSLKVGIFGAEPWTNDMRAEIEARVGIDAVDIYGLSEVMGPGVANECIETKDGLHIWEDHFLPEIVDPESGAPLADGAFGELCFTTLTKQALPVIRYRTRDLTRLMPGTARTMRRMEKVTGRSDDMLIIRGVNVFPSQIEELILKDERLAPHYQIEIGEDDHRMATLAVNVEARAEGGDTGDMAKTLAHHIKSLIGITAAVNIRAPGAVERSLGKAKRVVDTRKAR
jgi:phenylacetate-CoA ligase